MSALVHSLNPGALSKSCYVFHFTDSTLTSCILHYSKSQVSARRGRPALVPFTSDASLNLELGPTDHLPIPIFSLECGILTERKQKKPLFRGVATLILYASLRRHNLNLEYLSTATQLCLRHHTTDFDVPGIYVKASTSGLASDLCKPRRSKASGAIHPLLGILVINYSI